MCLKMLIDPEEKEYYIKQRMGLSEDGGIVGYKVVKRHPLTADNYVSSFFKTIIYGRGENRALLAKTLHTDTLSPYQSGFHIWDGFEDAVNDLTDWKIRTGSDHYCIIGVFFKATDILALGINKVPQAGMGICWVVSKMNVIREVHTG